MQNYKYTTFCKAVLYAEKIPVIKKLNFICFSQVFIQVKKWFGDYVSWPCVARPYMLQRIFLFLCSGLNYYTIFYLKRFTLYIKEKLHYIYIDVSTITWLFILLNFFNIDSKIFGTTF